MAQRAEVYPANYQELDALGDYLKRHSGLLQAFVEGQIADLKKTLTEDLAKRGSNSVQQQQAVDVWLPKFATLNYVFLIKYLELIYGVCIGQRDKSTHILSSPPEATYVEAWKKRVLFTLDSSSSTYNINGFHYTKRCVSYVEHWDQLKYKSSDLIALVRIYNSCTAVIVTNHNFTLIALFIETNM